MSDCIYYKPLVVNNHRCKWKFRILKRSYYLYFGVTDNDHITDGPQCCFGARGENKGFYYMYGVYGDSQAKYFVRSHVTNHKRISWGNCSWKVNDTITMELDLQKKHLSFWRNDKFIGIAFKNIECNSVETIYRCAIHVDGSPGRVKLEQCWTDDYSGINYALNNIENAIDETSFIFNQIISDNIDNNYNCNFNDKLEKFEHFVLLRSKLNDYQRQVHQIINAKLVQLEKQIANMDEMLIKLNQFEVSQNEYTKWTLNDIMIWKMDDFDNIDSNHKYIYKKHYKFIKNIQPNINTFLIPL